ncbi:MAG TPA: tetratricopeptide repeat protein [Desulfomonilaceae bacterium]|nr:tetratricopeptide repeat protein [Desulfomonilaceae bacterium]
MLVLCVSSVTYGQSNSPDGTTESSLSLADQALAEGRFQEAVRLYSKISDKSLGFLGSGMAHEMLNRPDMAIEDYRKAIEADSRNYRAMEKLAGMYERNGKSVAEAIGLYRRALRLDPRPEWKENLSVSIAILESRVRPAGTSAVRCWHLGNSKALGGDLKGAEAFYSRAISLNPELFQAHFSRGLVRDTLGNVEGAFADFQETVRIAPRYRGAFIQKGLLFEKFGDTAEARRNFEYATQNDSRDPEAWYHLARSLEAMQDNQQAMECYQECLSLKPKPELLKRIQERIAALVSSGVDIPKRNSSGLRKMKDLW